MLDNLYLRTEFEKACQNNENITTLFEYAVKCCHVTCFNSKCDLSTIVFLYTGNITRSYNIIIDNDIKIVVDELIEKCKWDLVYEKSEILEKEIEITDLLYISSATSFYILNKALNKYHNNVNKYIVIYNTHKYAIKGKYNNDPGLLPAIIKFIMFHNNWKICFYDICNDGITILEKQS